jgi:hypothetical protein
MQTMEVLPTRALEMIVLSSNQTNTFCGVGSHHQNGIAEKNQGYHILCSNIVVACKAHVS